MTDTIQRTFRTPKEARDAGWNVVDMAELSYAFRGHNEMFKKARILSPETLKCVEALEWSEWRGISGGCPSCGANSVYRHKTKDYGPKVHEPDCKLDLALRQVGVRP